MLRLFIKLTFTLLSLCAASIVTIHAQPLNDHDLQSLIQPGDCTMPCFMGIQPGLTSESDALDILKRSGWVQNIELHDVARGTSINHVISWAYWDWKTDAPLWFRPAPGALFGHSGAFDIQDGKVVDITIATNIPFGSIGLALGKPSGTTLAFSNVDIIRGIFTNARLHYRDRSLQSEFQTEAVSFCLATWNLWFKPSILAYYSGELPAEALSTVSDRPFLSQVRSLQPGICGVRW